jgi:FkbM family methyltransferase
LQRFDNLWEILRKPYHRLLDIGGHGVKIRVGGNAVVRLPGEFTGANWEEYEPETVAMFAEWVRQFPGGLVLDVGCSVGIFSAIALFLDPRCEVVAFDSDLPSLAATQRLCQHATGGRLRLVHGFLTERAPDSLSLVELVSQTQAALVQSGVRGEAGTTRYVCLIDHGVSSIPKYRLDDIFALEDLGGRPVLVKCDVEGAELLVLRGAEKFLTHSAADVLLSVHPDALLNYGHSRLEVQAFVNKLGYHVRILATDHEEHWWCEHKQKRIRPSLNGLIPTEFAALPQRGAEQTPLMSDDKSESRSAQASTLNICPVLSQ